MTTPPLFPQPFYEPAPHAEPDPARAAAPVRPCCLVLAESSSLRMLVSLILGLEGWDVSEQEDSPPTYQAVVADLDCFRGSADHVRRLVRQAGAHGVPVLVLTGQDLSPQERVALGSPALLPKPFELGAFVQVLNTWRPPAMSRRATGAA
ncbi:MAG TPA: hypothetical protein VM536_21385 [Chloroflexia bacterium]|nr:hypothetical protein [Chloroflexia bacterium]